MRICMSDEYLDRYIRPSSSRLSLLRRGGIHWVAPLTSALNSLSDQP